MRVPIAYALAYPERLLNSFSSLDMASVSQLTFEKADPGKFVCLSLAYEALRCGGTMPAVLKFAKAVSGSNSGAIMVSELAPTSSVA